MRPKIQSLSIEEGNCFSFLSTKTVMLLLMAYIHDAEDNWGVLRHLPEEEQIPAKKAIKKLRSLDRTKQALLVTHEIIEQNRSYQDCTLSRIHPSWLFEKLKTEDPRIVKIILSKLPLVSQKYIYRRLSVDVVEKLSNIYNLKSVHREIIDTVQQKFQSFFVPMPAGPRLPCNLRFQEVNLLVYDELTQLIELLSLDQFVAVFSNFGTRQLAGLCARVDSEVSDKLFTCYSQQPEVRVCDAADAFFCLRMTRISKQNRSLPLFRLSDLSTLGLFRLAQASTRESAEFVGQVAQILPRDTGGLFQSYVATLREKRPLGDAVYLSLQNHILHRFEELARQNKLNRVYGESLFCYRECRLQSQEGNDR